MNQQALNGNSMRLNEQTSLLKQLYLPISGEPHKRMSITPQFVVLYPHIQQSIDAKDTPLHQTTKILFLRLT